MDYINKLIQGHSLDVLRGLPDGSVHTVFTSSPYYSLRAYPNAETIWDSNNGCLHEWGTSKKTLTHKAGETNPGKESWFKDQGASEDKGNQYCQKCGAWQGQLGLEPHYSDFVRHLADIFNEFKRVLSDFGSLWVNLGDSYSGSMNGNNNHQEVKKNLSNQDSYHDKFDIHTSSKTDLLSKSLINIPHRFAVEMTNRGWVHRQTIIWKKNNCMPSSSLDRFTTDFEYIFLFTKGTKTQYYTNEKTLQCTRKKPLSLKGIENEDWEWIECQHCSGSKELKGKPCKRCDGSGKVQRSLWSSHDYFFNQQFEPHKEISLKRWGKGGENTNNTKYRKDVPDTAVGNLRNGSNPLHSEGRNARTTWEMSFEDYMAWCAELYHINKATSSIWEINTEPFSAAHFACFPRALAKRPIDAGCPEFVCRKCGLPRVKIYRFSGEYEVAGGGRSKKLVDSTGVSPTSSLKTSKVKVKEFAGYSDCGCKEYYCSNCNTFLTESIICDNFIMGEEHAVQGQREKKRISEELVTQSLQKNERIKNTISGDRLLQRKNLFELWGKILRAQKANVLFEKMCCKVASEKRYTQCISKRETFSELQRGDNHKAWIQDDCNQPETYTRTQMDNGTTSWKKTSQMGRSSSQKQDKDRQQNREFGSSDKNQPHGKNCVSALSEIFQTEIKCPFCHSKEIYIVSAKNYPGIVCDPFAGSGTTLQVAREMSRRYVGIEINPEYIDIANKFRLGQNAFNFLEAVE